MNKNLIVIVGPTAIGKTNLSIQLAKHFDSEIVSSDSRQFYKEMRIGTAVPKKEELEQVKHHFIQHQSVKNAYSVGDFEKEALKKIDKLFSIKDHVILIGGSGLYIDAVTKGLDYFPEIDKRVREQLIEELEKNGIESLQQQLKKVDPSHYEKVDLHNTHRVIRALEVCIGSGKTYSSFLTKPKKNRSFNIIKIGLLADRQIIYDRIDKRVDLMIKEGLLSEVQDLYDYKGLNALNTVGYKEIFSYLEGKWDIDFAISEIKKNTRRFAKRQLTWFRKDEEIKWFDYQYDHKQIVAYIIKSSL